MTVAIVGDGLAALVGYATLRRGGLEPDEITVFGTDPDPASAWRVRAAAIRRRRDGGRDRVAERARRRLDGDLRAPPRAGAPPAQRRPPLLHEARARRLPPGGARAARRAPARLPRAVLPARARLGRAARVAALPGRGLRQRFGAGHLRDGLPPRLRARPAARPARRGDRHRDRGELDR